MARTGEQTIHSTARERSWQLIQDHYHRRGWRNAYVRYEELIRQCLPPGGRVLDVGCGAGFPMAPVLLEWGAVPHGIDPTAREGESPPGSVLRVGSAYQIPYGDAAFDLMICRSVLEHLDQPERAFAEFHRVLKANGQVVFLAPNKYDYVSVGARLVPNRFHSRVVRWLEGRDESDTFPTYYRANTFRDLRRLARAGGFSIRRLERHNTYPSMLMFNRTLCHLGIAFDQMICAAKGLDWLKAWILGSMVRP